MELPRPALVVAAAAVVVAALLCNQSASAQQQQPPPARALDALLQDYAFRALAHPRSGTPYDAPAPSNLTGVSVAALRLRWGSLWKRGVPGYKEFHIPTGVVVQPYARRVVLVYHNLANWSEFFYPIEGRSYLTALVGLFVYDAANLTAEDLPELSFVASGDPILVRFSNVSHAPTGAAVQCVRFDLDGVPQLGDTVGSNACAARRRGHLAIVAGPPASGRKSSNVWKIVVGVAGGIAGLLLLRVVVLCTCRSLKERELRDLERKADASEALGTAAVGAAKLPVALGARTQPVLEGEYAG